MTITGLTDLYRNAFERKIIPGFIGRDGIIRYKGRKGKRCSLGIFIADTPFYRREMENVSGDILLWGYKELLSVFPVIEGLPRSLVVDFWSAVQICHDERLRHSLKFNIGEFCDDVEEVYRDLRSGTCPHCKSTNVELSTPDVMLCNDCKRQF